MREKSSPFDATKKNRNRFLLRGKGRKHNTKREGRRKKTFVVVLSLFVERASFLSLDAFGGVEEREREREGTHDGTIHFSPTNIAL